MAKILAVFLILLTILLPVAYAEDLEIQVEGGYTFTFKVYPPESGCFVYITNLKFLYKPGDNVNVICVARPGYYFKEWDFPSSSPEPYVAFGVSPRNDTVTAIFERIPLKGDFTNDAKVGLKDAIGILQMLSGMR